MQITIALTINGESLPTVVYDSNTAAVSMVVDQIETAWNGMHIKEYNRLGKIIQDLYQQANSPEANSANDRKRDGLLQALHYAQKMRERVWLQWHHAERYGFYTPPASTRA